MKKKRWIIIGVVLLVAVIGVAAAAEYGKYRMGLIPEMSFEEVLNYTTRDNPDASSESYKTMGIYMDEVAYAWMIDTHNGIIWHNGGTGDD